jgi:predicted acylesterase/phospholipase RssA
VGPPKEENSKQTKFFKSTLGVFQGGGCRAAAFAGAYEVAVKRGVRFTEVAGTSAGSIVAALIGASATPDQLLTSVTNLDFNRFLAEPTRTAKRSIWAQATKLNGLLSKLADIYYDLGLHSSAYIEEWTEAQLRTLLPDQPHPIPFKALPLPTWIVAADAKGERVRVWSSSDTPDESVSMAVRASCSIPIFFQPVEGRYFDGGVLSNLPTFVFNKHSESDRPLSSRVIAFTLKSSDQAATDIHPLLKLVNTVVDGAQELQLKIQGNVPLLSISTGKIRATDFGLMSPKIVEDLIQNGRTAAERFFAAELGNASDPFGADRICYGKEEFFAAVGQDPERVSELLISENDTDFVYALFPTLLYWRLRGVPIRALLRRHEPSHHGPYRRRLLNLLGISVSEIDDLPARAYISNANSAIDARAVVGVPSSSALGKIEGVIYEGAIDQKVTASLHQFIDKEMPGIELHEGLAHELKFEDVSHTSVVDGLRRVLQYSSSRIEIELREVPISQLVSITKFVREYKYRQIEILESIYAGARLRAFGPARVLFGDKIQTTLVTPPVVEENGSEFILIEGTTRATFLRDRGAKSLLCFVVRGVSDALPAERVNFSRVRVVSKTLSADDRYPGFKYGRFRHIESAVRPLNSLVLPAV